MTLNCDQPQAHTQTVLQVCGGGGGGGGVASIIFMHSAIQEDDLAAIDRLIEKFATPLQSARAVIKAEFGNMIEYAIQYIATTSLNYHSVWWRLFHIPSSAEWSNVLILVQLLLSIPASIEWKAEAYFLST